MNRETYAALKPLMQEIALQLTKKTKSEWTLRANEADETMYFHIDSGNADIYITTAYNGGGVYFSAEDLKACGSSGISIKTLIGFAVRGGWGGQGRAKKIRKDLFDHQHGLSAVSGTPLDLNSKDTTVDHIFEVKDAVKEIVDGAEFKTVVAKVWAPSNLRLVTRAENCARNRKEGQ